MELVASVFYEKQTNYIANMFCKVVILAEGILTSSLNPPRSSFSLPLHGLIPIYP